MRRATRISLSAIAFAAAFVLSVQAGALATGIADMIPKSASAVLFVDYAKDGFGDRVLNFFNKVASAEDAKQTDALRQSLGFSFDNPVFLSTISKVALVTFADAPKEGAQPPMAMVIALAKKEAFMTHLSNLKVAITKDGRYNLYAKKDQPDLEVLENAKDKSDYFVFTVQGDYLVAGSGGEKAFDAVKKCIEASKDPAASLASSPNYAAALKAFPDDRPVYFYMDGEYMKNYSASENIMKELDFVKAFCFSVGASGTRVSADAMFVTDGKNKGNAFLRYFSKEGGELSAPAMLDPDTVLFMGGKFNFDAKAVASDKALGESKAQINSLFGIDFDKDMAPWLGEEFFVSVSDFKILPLPVLPAPRIYFGVKFKDREACAKCLDKIMTALKIRAMTFKETKLGDVAIYHAPVQTPGNVMPDFGLTFALFKDYFVITTAKDSVAALISASQKKDASLAAQKAFADGAGPLAKSSLFTFFYNGALGAEMLAGLAKLSPDAGKLESAELDALKSVNSAAGGFNLSGENFSMRFVTDLNKEAVAKTIAGAMKAPAAPEKPEEKKDEKKEK